MTRRLAASAWRPSGAGGVDARAAQADSGDEGGARGQSGWPGARRGSRVPPL